MLTSLNVEEKIKNMLDRSLRPEIKSLEEFVVISPERCTLPNGIPLNILNVGNKEIVRIDFVFEAGRWQQEYLLQAVLTNRMLREGTISMNASEIAERLDFYGAWLDLSVSASNAFVTLYSLEKYLQPTLDVLESMLKAPLFPDKELDTIVGNNLQQYLISQTKTDVLARKSLLRTLYGERHPYGKSVCEEDYRKITSALLKQFFKEYYHAGNCTIYLSGKISAACIEMIEARFGTDTFNQGEMQSVPKCYSVETSPEKRIFVEQPFASQSSVRMGMLTVGCHHPDFAKTRVLVTLLGGYFGSRLMSNIREDKGYTYGISAGIVPYADHGMFLVAAETAPEFVSPLIAEVYNEIDRLQQELVSAEELSMVRNYMIGDMCRTFESAFSLADAWIYADTLGLPESHFSDVFCTVKTICAEEIRSLAQQYLCKEKLKEVVSGKKMS